MNTFDQFRKKTRTWLEENWDPNLSLIEWRIKLTDTGWGMPDWPEEWYGKGLQTFDIPKPRRRRRRLLLKNISRRSAGRRPRIASRGDKSPFAFFSVKDTPRPARTCPLVE